MKKIFLSFLLSFIAVSSFAQIRDAGFYSGVLVPFNQEVGSDGVYGVNYGHFYWNGLGFRAGVQWSPYFADVDNYFAVPVAFAYRTRVRVNSERVLSAAIGASNALEGLSYYDTGDVARGLLAGLLAGLISDVEYFVGVTPGFVQGASSSVSRSVYGSEYQYWEKEWMEKRTSASLLFDAGICFNYRIWRFDLKLTPAMHYSPINTYVRHSESGEVGVEGSTKTESPLHWFFSFSGGLSFRF